MKANVYDKGRASDGPPLNEVEKPVPRKTKSPGRTGWATWLVPAALILLSFMPLVAGALRLTQLGGGPEIIPANPRFSASPLPVIIHIVTVTVYAILGAFQFSTRLRQRRPGWHRAAGRILVLCGLVVGLSGLWMTLFYPRAEGTGDLLYALRLLFGSAMVMSIILGYAAIRRGDVTQHRAWMTRGYAIGLGAGTQALTQMVGSFLISQPSELSGALLMGSGWVINLAVAESPSVQLISKKNDFGMKANVTTQYA